MSKPDLSSPHYRQALEVALPILERAAEHYDCEDCWYSCATLTCDEGRRGECDCRARAAAPVLSLVLATLVSDLCDWCNAGEHAECERMTQRVGLERCGCQSGRHHQAAGNDPSVLQEDQ